MTFTEGKRPPNLTGGRGTPFDPKIHPHSDSSSHHTKPIFIRGGTPLALLIQKVPQSIGVSLRPLPSLEGSL